MSDYRISEFWTKEEEARKRRSMGSNLAISCVLGFSNGDVAALAADYATRADRSVRAFPDPDRIERTGNLLVAIAAAMREM